MKYDLRDRFCFVVIAVAMVMAAIAMHGCANLQKTTMQTEFTLSAANSMCFHIIDGVDAEETDRLRVQNLNGDHDGALQAYADYKPKMDKARAACNGSDDLVQNAERLRLAIPKGGSVDAFTAYLPTLSATLLLVEQAIADVKGMVQK